MAEDNDGTQTTDDGENSTIRQLRDEIKSLKAENKALAGFRETAEPTLRDFALEKAGFKPGSKRAEALLKLHGEGELTAEALQATADEWELTGGDTGDTSETSTETPTLTPEQQQAIASTARGEQTAAVGQPGSQPQTHAQRQMEAMESGDLNAMREAAAAAAADWRAGRT